MMRGILLIVPCAVVGLCACPGPPPEVHRGEYPVATIQRSADGTEASALLVPGVAITEVLDISPFEGFRPGMTPAQAEALHGPPVRVEKGTWEESYHFRNGDAIVEVVAMKSESELDSRIVTHYVLRVSVDDPQYLDLLPPSIRSVCASAVDDMWVAIASQEQGDPVIRLKVREGKVQSVKLLPPIPATLQAPANLPAS